MYNQKSAGFDIRMVCENYYTLWCICFKFNALPHHTVVSVLVLGIGITRGLYNCMLKGLLGIEYPVSCKFTQKNKITSSAACRVGKWCKCTSVYAMYTARCT